MFDNNENESIEELRAKYLNDLDYTQGTPTPTPSPQTPKNKKPKKRGTFWPALIGAVIGGLIVGLIMYGLFFFTQRSTISEISTNTGTTITYTGEDASTAVEAVAQIVPQSVVGISATGVETTETIFGPQSQTYSSVGSGFFVTENGYIVTNQHVVGDQPGDLIVSTADDEDYPAELIWSDASLDLAVLKVDISGAPVLNLGDSENIKVGQTVVAVGNPLGLAYSRSVTSGIVSAIDRTIVGSNNQIVAEGLIQTDAAINSGNSGGPLVNVAGEVIGVNTYKASSGEGIGLAIPINLFKPIIEEVIQTGSFAPRIIGVTGYDPEQAKYSLNGELENFTSGFYIVSVTDGSPAQAAGLQPGDIIKAVDGKEINTLLQLRTILYNHKKDDRVTVTYERGGQEYTTDMTITTSEQ